MCLVAFFSQDDLEETALAFVGKIQGKVCVNRSHTHI